MGNVLQFTSEDGTPLFVEVEENDFGVENIARGDGSVIVQAASKLEEALDRTRKSLHSLLHMLQEMTPDEHEIEFGIKLNAEAGVMVAKTAAEGHFAVRMKWSRDRAATPGGPEA